MAEKSADSKLVGEKDCFVIMPISDPEGYTKGHFLEVYSELIRPAVENAGFKCTRADDVISSNLIHLDVVTRVVNADLCICDLSTRNPNVLFEYGIRQAFDRPTVLIKDNITERIFDVSNFRDIEYDHTLRIKNILSARNAITAAINATVNGNSDDGQVFSLVKLMGLTQAARLPAEGLDKETAQYQIIGKRLEALQDMVQRLEMRMRQPDSDIDIGWDRSSNGLQLYDDGSARVFFNGRTHRFKDLPSFQRSPLSKQLPTEMMQRLKDHLIPF